MKKGTEEVLLGIKSRNSVFILAQKLKQADIAHRVVSTPSSVGLPCGLSIAIAPSDYVKVLKIASSVGIRISAVLRAESFGICDNDKRR